MNRTILVTLLLSVLGLSTTGCFSTSPAMFGLAESLDRDLPGVELERQFGISLGRMSVGLAKGVAKWSMDEDERSEFSALRGIKRVEVATFETRPLGNQEVDWNAEIWNRRLFGEGLRRDGWETIARFSSDDEFGWVVFRPGQRKLSEVVVVLAEDHELTMVRLRGDLQKVMRAALNFSRESVMDEERESSDSQIGSTAEL